MANNLDMNCSEINSSSDLQSIDNHPESIIPESDNDSGIVAIANRIGSTASNSDEDNVFREKLSQSANHQLNYGNKPRVRFDDELPLSEQNMRKSCKKLFETLKHQNKENIMKEEPNGCQPSCPSLLPSCHCHHFKQIKPNNKCCAHSEQTDDNNKVSFDDNELLLTNYGQPCNYIREPVNTIADKHNKKYNSLDSRLANRVQRPLTINDNKDTKQSSRKSFDCDDALNRIKQMSDRLESSSMVNAFARPAFIKSAEFGQTMDTLYETIFPTEKSETSPNSHVKQWLNKVEPFDRPQERQPDFQLKNRDITPVIVSNPNPSPLSRHIRPRLEPMPVQEAPKLHSLAQTRSAYISADQIYPDQCEDDITNEELTRSYEEKINRFSNSYSAGEDAKRGILRHRIKSAVSEIDLNQTKLNSSPKSKGFLQRFKTALSRAFTNEKISKQSILEINTVHNSKSLSQTDLRYDCNLKSSRVSIAVDTRPQMDRSPSFVKNLKTRMSFRRSPNKVNSNERMMRSNSQKSLSMESQRNTPSKSSKLEADANVWGELIKLNSDSSQVIQIHRQKGRAFGFFVARGTVNNIKGVFVSRMKDEDTQRALTGVLEIGDEILAIDGESVKEANIMRVNQLIANKDTIRLTIIPYMNNKYL